MQEYEGAVEDRNHTGIMLIDRNDELCILYEKANTQEEVMRKGNTHRTCCKAPVTHLTCVKVTLAFPGVCTMFALSAFTPYGDHALDHHGRVSVRLCCCPVYRFTVSLHSGDLHVQIFMCTNVNPIAVSQVFRQQDGIQLQRKLCESERC